MPARPPMIPPVPRSKAHLIQLDVTRDIDAKTLVERLQDFALSDQFRRGAKVRMTGEQIRAAELLLRKVVPDLNRTTLDGDPEKPMQGTMRHVVEFVRPSKPPTDASKE